MDPDEAIYEAAAAPKIPKWPLLKAFMLRKGVELAVIDAKSSKEWTDDLLAAREELNAMITVTDSKNQKASEKAVQGGSNKVEDRGCSMESQRESDDDSGYSSDRYKDLNDRPISVNFLVPEHELYDGAAALYCTYCDIDDRNYIAKSALTKLNIPEGADGRVTLSFIDGGRSSARKFFVQDSTVKGEKFESNIRFGMKPVEGSDVGDESPLEDLSHMAFDGDAQADSETSMLQTHKALMRQGRTGRPLREDQARALGYAIGVAVGSSDEDPLTLGHKVGVATGAALDSFPG